MNKYLLVALPAIALLLVLAAHASAATITSNNANDLSYIIYYTNTSVNISASGDKIALINTDANHSALVVFNPSFSVIIDNVTGAEIAVVNMTNNYSVVETVNASTAGYAGKSVNPSLALALIIPANSTATLGAVYYTASEDVAALNAPTPPSGYKLIADKQGSGDTEFTGVVDTTGSIWVAFWSESDTASLIVYYKANINMDYPIIALTANPSKFVTGTARLDKPYTLHFQVSGTNGKQWEVLWAYKPDPGMEPQPTKTPEPSKTARPSAEIPSDNDKKLEYAVAGLAFLLILFMAISLTGRRR